MFKEKSTYGDFINSEEKIATNILADRLALLESGGIISKHNHPEHKLKIVYKLTSKGIDLVPVLVEIILWSEKHHEVHHYARQFANQVKKSKHQIIQQIASELKKR